MYHDILTHTVSVPSNTLHIKKVMGFQSFKVLDIETNITGCKNTFLLLLHTIET